MQTLRENPFRCVVPKITRALAYTCYVGPSGSICTPFLVQMPMTSVGVFLDCLEIFAGHACAHLSIFLATPPILH